MSVAVYDDNLKANRLFTFRVINTWRMKKNISVRN
jgi:hypothetical protein